MIIPGYPEINESGTQKQLLLSVVYMSCVIPEGSSILNQRLAPEELPVYRKYDRETNRWLCKSRLTQLSMANILFHLYLQLYSQSKTVGITPEAAPPEPLVFSQRSFL